LIAPGSADLRRETQYSPWISTTGDRQRAPIPCCENREFLRLEQGIPPSRAGNFAPFGPILWSASPLSRLESGHFETETANSGMQNRNIGMQSRCFETAGGDIEAASAGCGTVPGNFGTAGCFREIQNAQMGWNIARAFGVKLVHDTYCFGLMWPAARQGGCQCLRSSINP
jgi:hypothetical protein